MVQINPYDLMYKQQNETQPKKQDKIDKHIEFLNGCDNLEEAKEYILANIELSENGWVNFPELNKDLYIVIEDNKVEFCALKNKEQYYGKGWLARKTDEL